MPRIALLPILVPQKNEKNLKNTCPICLQSFSGEKIADSKIKEFYYLLHYQLEQTLHFQVIPRRSVHEYLLEEYLENPSLPQLTGEKLGPWEGINSSWEVLMAKAQAVDIPYLLSATLYRYEERQGKNYAVVKPASVTFDLHLIQTRDKRILWSKHHRETQKALSEDLWEISKVIQRRARWLTARDLSREAIQKMLQEMPHFPTTQISGYPLLGEDY